MERAATTMPSVHELAQPDAPGGTTTAWPVVLGVLSIVAGYEAIRAFGTVSPAALRYVVARLSQGGFAAVIGSSLRSWALIFLGLSMCAGVLGILGGVLLLLRRRAALVLHWLYALVSVAAIGLFLVAFGWQLATRKYGGPGRHTYDLLTHAGAGLVYPVLVMIWFRRFNVRRHMRRWRTRAGRIASEPAGPIWPGVLGVLAVYWGATGALSSSLSLVGSIAWLDKSGGRWGGYRGSALVVMECAMVGLAVLSIVWGALLRRRKRAAVVLCWVYTVAGVIVILVVVTPVVMHLVKTGERAIYVGTIPGTASRAVMLLPWPVFLLVWLARPRIRAQAKAWRAERVEGLEPAGEAGGAETITMGRDSPAPPEDARQ